MSDIYFDDVVVGTTFETATHAITAADIAAYVATGEPLDKAGAYAIQGGAERWIEHLSGSYSGVMGLPLLHTDRLLARCGVPAPTADAAREAADV